MKKSKKIIHAKTFAIVLRTPDIAVSFSLSIPFAYVGNI